MTNHMRKFAILLAVLLLPVSGSLNSAPSKQLLLNVISSPRAYGDSQVDQKLVRHLTRRSDLRVKVVSEGSDYQPPFPGDYHNIDSLLEWGREAGGRYLMVVEVTSQRLEKRKGFHLPLVFHKYETVGVIEGELRFLDLSRGKLLTAEPFKVERKGPRIFQATMDDDVNDPDLHITAPAKIVFFNKLEESLCQHLAKRIGALAGGR